MKKLWSVFSVIALVGLVSLATLAQEEASTPEKSSEESDTQRVDLLDLPSFPAEWIEPKPSPVRIGDRIYIEVSRLTVPEAQEKSLKVSIPAGSSSLVDLGWSVSSQVLFKGNDRVRLTFTPVKAGNLTLPPLVLSSSDGTPLGRTESLQIVVESLSQSTGEKEQPLQYYLPVGVGLPQWAVVGGSLLGTLLMVLIVFGLIKLVKFIAARNQAKRPVQPPRPADEIALEMLARLRAEKLWEKGELKPHYFGVSDTLKLYLSKRFEIDAVESTTSEMLEEVSVLGDKGKINTDIRTQLGELFDKLDLVKFTDMTPPDVPGESVEILDVAVQVVQATKAPPTVVDQNRLDDAVRKS